MALQEEEVWVAGGEGDEGRERVERGRQTRDHVVKRHSGRETISIELSGKEVCGSGEASVVLSGD